MVAEKTLTVVLNTRYIPATMVLTITGAATRKNSSIKDGEGDSLKQKIREAAWL
jgi:hypothetical protein